MVTMDISNILWVFLTWMILPVSALPNYSNLTMTLDVSFGKSVKVDFSDILRHVNISANSNETIRNDRCQIRVLDKETIYAKVGFISAGVFPCHSDNVTYSHLGFESPSEDIVKFRLEYFTATDFIDYTLFLILKIGDRNENTFVRKGLPLRISEKSTESKSLPIIRKAVLFQDEDFSLDFCTVETIEHKFFPLYGKLTKNGIGLLSNAEFNCQEFFNGELRYELTAEVFSSSDLLIFKINYFLGDDLEDAKNVSSWSSEYFQMPVQIEHADSNSPPEIDFAATLLLDVSNFVIRSITREVLLAKDVDGASSAQLRYQVTQAPELSDGFLIRFDDPIHPIDSFSQKDVDTGKIAFRPPLVNTQTDRLLEIVLEIADPQELTSHPVPLMIVIHPTSYYAPFVVINTGLTVYEGEAATLWETKNLAVADEDNLDEVALRVVSGLAHGRLLLRGDSVKQFVPGDLQTGALRYQHDGSDSLLDSMVLQMDDGQHQVDFLLPITIRPVDDQPPVLLTNTGILVHSNKQIVNITSKILKAKDRDSESSLIRFVLKSSLSYGRFLLTNETLAISNAVTVTEWTQGDINAGHLFYQHDDEHSDGRTTWHAVEFILEDNNAPLPNLSPHLQTLTITVIPLDTLPPHLSSAASMRLHVNGSQVAIIGNGILHFVDDQTSDRDLSLIVHTGPQFGRLIWTSTFSGRNWPAAQAASDDAYDVNLIERQIPQQFPQSALAYGDIAYQADNVLEDTRDKIVFNVRDKQGNVLKEQVLHISIHPLSDAAPHSNLQEIRPKSRRFSQQPPAVLTRPVIVKEGETAIINDDYLLISPSDHPLAAITLRLDLPPQRGTLSLQNKTLALHDHFPAIHITNGDLIYYQNITANSQNSLEDHITFSLSDKASKEPTEAKLHIRIIPQPSTKPPRKLGLTKLGLVLQVKENTPFYFTSHTFVGSSNPPPSDLVFHVEKSPNFGTIFLSHNQTSSFTWKDIEDGNVFYKAKSDPKVGAVENALFDDEVSFRIESPTTEWIMNEKIIDHLEIQILLVPGNPVTSVGKPFVVGEGQSALLSEEHLVIVAPPYQRVNCSLVNQPSHGHLVDIRRNISVVRFSNYELLEHRIFYHQSHYKQVEPRSDSIRLNCAGTWVELPVTIHPTNDEPPLINTNHLQVAAGEQVLLSAFISITDVDHPFSPISINITRFPQHGVIVGRFTDFDPNEILIEPPFRPVRNFSLIDLLLPDRIFYRHDGTRTFSDNFTITVTDGVNTVEKEIFVVVHEGDNSPSEDEPLHFGLTEYITAPFELIGLPQETLLFNTTANQLASITAFSKPDVVVRDQMPNITYNIPNKALILLPNKHLGVKLTPGVLTVLRDEFSTQKELLFEVVEQPKFGHFVDLHKAERHIRVFTEELVNSSAVAYALDLDKEFATEDSFKLRAINELGKKSELIEGKINWSWISFMKDRHETNEMTGLVKVGLRRRGNLKNRDFVAVKARDLTTVMGRDYKENYALQAEFQPGQNETSVEIRVLKDDLFEDREYFQLVLEEPQFANVEKPFVVTITISDQDDGAMVYIPHPLYTVSEDVGVFNLTLKRSGKDLSQSVSVICYTTDGTASGTVSHQQQIFRPDFGTRLNIHSSVVTFGPHETTKTCPIVIVNDAIAENDETFYVNIRTLESGSRVGVYQQTEIVIRRDPEDEPSVSFAKNEYSTTIFDPFVEVQVERKGGDLSQPSEVDIISEQGKRVEVVYFGPGESSQTTTLKRLGEFNVTNDMFRVYLNNSQYSKIPLPNFATVHVKKSMNFTVVSTLGGEPEMPVTDNEIVLLSKYDTPVEPSLLPGAKTRYECINCDKNKIALDKIDFTSVEHDEPQLSSLDEIFAADVPSRKSSYGPFYREERERQYKKNKVEDWKDGMIDTAPNGRTVPERGIPIVRGGVIMKQGVAAGERSRSASTISFAKAQYDITEPSSLHHMHWVSIPIIRYGDISKSDTVRVITKDGSAKAGQDFEAVDTIVNFEPNRSQEVLQVRIIFDETREPNENFTMHIFALRRTVADLKTSMTVVTIREQSGENVRFPGAPVVVNLANYDSPVPGGWVAIGQPLICITTCNSRHPDYQRTRRVCEIEGIDDSRTTYSWKISQPQDDSIVLEPLQHIRSTAWFASIYEKVLDSIYFSNGSIIQCSARAVTGTGLGGYESISEIVTSVGMKPQCPSKGRASAVTVDPFEATISNMKNGDVKIIVKLPHRIGLVPLISTASITDLHLTLGGEGTRTAEHLCSNMLTEQELRSTRNGFLRLKSGRQGDSRHPLEILRGPRTQEFYRHLDLKNCQWTFEAIYSMTEILNVCGGKLITDAKAQTSSKREVIIQLPLYVTYAYFTNAVGTPWKHYDQSTVLDIVISYDNVLTWSPDYSTIPVFPPSMKSESSLELSGPVSPRTVIHLQSAKNSQRIMPVTHATPVMSRYHPRTTTAPPVPLTSNDHLSYPAELKVIQSRVVDDGHHMNVRFKTKPKFRGKYLLDTSKSRTGAPLAKVILLSSPQTAFELQLLKTQENNANPQQLWRFRSVRASQIPYGGAYNITLLPCEFDAGSLTTCKIREPVTFVVHLTV